MELKDFYNSLKNIRELQNLTIDQLSGMSGVDSSQISSVENKRKNYSFESTVKILNALNMDFNDCLKSLDERQLLIKKIKELLYKNFDNDEIIFLHHVFKMF